MRIPCSFNSLNPLTSFVFHMLLNTKNGNSQRSQHQHNNNSQDDCCHIGRRFCDCCNQNFILPLTVGLDLMIKLNFAKIIQQFTVEPQKFLKARAL